MPVLSVRMSVGGFEKCMDMLTVSMLVDKAEHHSLHVQYSLSILDLSMTHKA